jgi:hypothetical protein
MHVADYDVGYIDAQNMEANEAQTLNSFNIIQKCSYLCSLLMRFLIGFNGSERIFNPETVGIRKENSTENIRTHKRKPVMGNQNQ